jgi:hypothetical protein
MRTWILLLALLAGAGQGGATDPVHPVLKRLEKGINTHAVTALLGPVDVEFVYTFNPQTRSVALLEPGPEPPVAEKEEAPAPVVPRDSLDMAVLTDAATFDAAALDPCCGGGGGDGMVAWVDSTTGDSIWVPVEVPVKPQAETQRPRPEIPADLADTDLDVLKARLTPPDGIPERTAYLAVLEVTADPRQPVQRLSLAADELSLMERRLLRWDAHQIYRNWPTGALLCLTSAQQDLDGYQATLPITWELRRPGAPGADPRVLVSGALDLELRQVDDQWLLSGIQHLVGTLHRAVVPTGVVMASAAVAP